MINCRFILAISTLVIFVCAGVSAQPERAIQFQKYIVKEGETPGYIAERFNIKKKDFLMLNNFPSNVVLKPGEEVLIRQLKPGEKPVEEGASGGQYSANNGSNTDFVITDEDEPAPKPAAKTTDKPASAPARKSSESPSASAPPAETPVAAPPPAPAAPKSTQTGPNGAKYVVSDNNYHIVQKGQTFYRIALIYGLTVDQLKQLNNMSNTNISVGQKLRVK